jgi:outer membrane protein assembly factor BamB
MAHLVAVRASDGAILWQTPFDYSDLLLAANDHTVYGTTLIGSVVAFDAQSGQPLAAFPDNGASIIAARGAVTGSVIAATGQFVLIKGGRGLQALSTVDGHVLWDARVDFGAGEESATAVRVTDNLIIGGDGTQVITAVRVRDGSIARHLV